MAAGSFRAVSARDYNNAATFGPVKIPGIRYRNLILGSMLAASAAPA